MNMPQHSDPADLASDRLAGWLHASAQGNMAAFRRLHDATRERLLAIAMEVLPQRVRAEEALQDAYVKVWRAAAQFNPAKARPMTWLMRIVRNSAIGQRGGSTPGPAPAADAQPAACRRRTDRTTFCGSSVMTR